MREVLCIIPFPRLFHLPLPLSEPLPGGHSLDLQPPLCAVHQCGHDRGVLCGVHCLTALRPPPHLQGWLLCPPPLLPPPLPRLLELVPVLRAHLLGRSGHCGVGSELCSILAACDVILMSCEILLTLSFSQFFCLCCCWHHPFVFISPLSIS